MYVGANLQSGTARHGEGSIKHFYTTNGENKMSYPKLETIPFETITKVVKNCTTIKKKERNAMRSCMCA